MNEELPVEEVETDPPTEGASDEYDEFLKDEDDREALRQRALRDRGIMAAGLAFLLTVSLAGNYYQLTQTKLIPFIDSVDEHGQVVTRKLVLAKNVPDEDPKKLDAISNYVKQWIISGRFRSFDHDITGGGINAALAGSAGLARVSLSNELREEKVWDRIDVKKETVQVLMPKWPVHFPGTNSWQAEWEEIVTGPNKVVTSRQSYAGTFHVATQDNWIEPGNAYGVKVVGYSRQPFNK